VPRRARERLPPRGLRPVKSTGNRGRLIDFVLGSASFAERVTGAFNDREERDPTVFAGAPWTMRRVAVELTD
jgi:exodeoxyribonuclease-3